MPTSKYKPFLHTGEGLWGLIPHTFPLQVRRKFSYNQTIAIIIKQERLHTLPKADWEFHKDEHSG